MNNIFKQQIKMPVLHFRDDESIFLLLKLKRIVQIIKIKIFTLWSKSLDDERIPTHFEKHLINFPEFQYIVLCIL